MAQIECLVKSENKDDLAIIFIHGLNGDARGTWMRNKDDDATLWPRWFASDIDCSVWLLSYDAKLSNWQNNAMPLPDQGDSVLETLSTEEGLKNRPLLLIGHSMGGLVIKTLINHGRTKGVIRYQNVVSRIHGIVFIATPHNGSQMATLAKHLSVFLRTNPQVGDMKIHDSHLRSLHQQFLAYFNAPDIHVAVRTFAETKGVLIGKRFFGVNWGKTKLVVDPSSSEPHVPNEIAIPLPEDHSSICKLENKESQLYKSVLSFIRDELRPKCQLLQGPKVEIVEGAVKLPPSDKIQITKLPHTNSRFFGREAELAMLDRAWDEGVNVLILKAMGGSGKTALIKHWLDRFVVTEYRNAEAVFTWSFYSQGSAENKQTSTEDFFESALRFFGYSEQNLPSPYERGIKLAQLVASRRSLLILDGLEPLQHPVGIFHGEVKDQALKTLLQQLAVRNPGLCLISSRQAVEELKGKLQKLVLSHDLDHLKEADGVALLRDIGVKGSDVDLTNAVTEVSGHALTLNLLGNYVKKVFLGDIRQRDKIAGFMDERTDGKHARKILAAYEQHLKDSLALHLLYLLGLFDRPVSPGAIQSLKQAEIVGFTEQFGSDADWMYAIDDLREQRLLNAPSPDYPDNLDCHPLIREYFGKQLQHCHPAIWQRAHNTLYDYYKALPQKKLPDTLEEMQPLFSAVAHGCAAGLYQQVLDEVCWPRMQRDEKHYLTSTLGAFSDDLATAANFFSSPWHSPASALKKSDQALMLNWAGFCLRALGRLREAQEPIQASMEIQVKSGDWKNAVNGANNLSELHLSLGEMENAKVRSQQSSGFADRSGDLYSMIKSRTNHGNTLHQAGDTARSLTLFQEAEQYQKKFQPQFPFLYSLNGFLYCDLLLANDRTADVINLAKSSLALVATNNWPLDIGLDQLSLGRAHLQRAAEKPAFNCLLASTQCSVPLSERGNEEELSPLCIAAEWLDKAVTSLRKAGALDHLPRGLLARNTLNRMAGDFKRAEQDLQEVFEIVEVSGMKLFRTDYHLEKARLLLAQRQFGEAQMHIKAAKTLIDETGYHRRDLELEELQKQLISTSGHKESGL